MNVITLASRKGGAGKSTLTAQLAAQCHVAGKRTLVIDADPQGSLSLWHSLRRRRAAEAGHARARHRARARVRDDRGLRLRVHRHRADHVGGGAGGDPRRDAGADSGAAGLLRSRRGARDGEGRARAQQALCGGDQRRAGASATTRRPALVAQSRAYFDGLQIPVWAGQISQRAGFQSTLAAGASAAEIGPNTAAGHRDRQALGRGREERRGDQQRAVRAGAGGERVDEPNGRARRLSRRLRAGLGIVRRPPMRTSVPPYSASHEQAPVICRRMSAIGYQDGHNCSPRDSLPVAGRRPCFQGNKRNQAGLPRSANQEARAWESSAAS